MNSDRKTKTETEKIASVLEPGNLSCKGHRETSVSNENVRYLDGGECFTSICVCENSLLYIHAGNLCQLHHKKTLKEIMIRENSFNIFKRGLAFINTKNI